MPVTIDCEDLLVSLEEVNTLWSAVRALRSHSDDDISIRCVSSVESAELNERYRSKKGATNVLTFSYGREGGQTNAAAEHDVAFCKEVVAEEADEQGVSLRDYTARVVVHALLHVTGMDHEQSESAAEEQAQAERAILRDCGFAPDAL